MKSLITFSLFFVFAVSTAFALGLDNDQAAKNLIVSGRINHAKGVDIASNATVDLNSVAGNLVHVIGGASTITSFGTPSQAGIQRRVIFDGVDILFGGTNLVIPGTSTHIVTAAGDSILAVSDSTAKWIVLDYTRKATNP